MVLDSNKFGLIEIESVEFCIKNWPYPVDKHYSMEFETGEIDYSSYCILSRCLMLSLQSTFYSVTGVYAKMSEDHDEL